jgi:hypothetical protein
VTRGLAISIELNLHHAHAECVDIVLVCVSMYVFRKTERIRFNEKLELTSSLSNNHQ